MVILGIESEFFAWQNNYCT